MRPLPNGFYEEIQKIDDENCVGRESNGKSNFFDIISSLESFIFFDKYIIDIDKYIS